MTSSVPQNLVLIFETESYISMYADNEEKKWGTRVMNCKKDLNVYLNGGKKCHIELNADQCHVIKFHMSAKRPD